MKNLLKLGFAALLSISFNSSQQKIPRTKTACYGRYPEMVFPNLLILPELFISYAARILKSNRKY
jgi:hypothetical protein